MVIINSELFVILWYNHEADRFLLRDCEDFIMGYSDAIAEDCDDVVQWVRPD